MLLISFVCIQFSLLYLEKQELPIKISPYPHGKNFAFTVTDDPDKNRLKDKKIVYDYLNKIGLKTTVLVWVKKANKTNLLPIQPVHNYRYGDTLENEDYLNYILHLHNSGFEIGTHTITAGADYREETLEGYEEFKRIFGKYPKMVIMHSHNLDNLYWGKYVFDQNIIQKLAGLIIKTPYGGHIENSDYFWGDFARENIKYIRLWGSSNINTLAFNKSMPYKIKSKPFVNYFHSFSDGYNCSTFTKLISDENIDKLKNQRGASIVYTHFADGYVDRKGQLDPDFSLQIKKIADSKEGWFVPASELLDRLIEIRNIYVLKHNGCLYIANCNNKKVDGLTILKNKNRKRIYDSMGKEMIPNNENEIIISSIGPFEYLRLYDNKRNINNENKSTNDTLIIKESMSSIIVINAGKDRVKNCQIPYRAGQEYYDKKGKRIKKNTKNYLVIENLNPNQVYVVFKNPYGSIRDSEIGLGEYINLISGRIAVYIKNGNFLKPKYWRRN